MFVIFQKIPPRGLADVDMLFITHITRECTDGRRLVWETTPPPVWDSLWGVPKEAHVLCMILNYITSVCTCRKKKSKSTQRTRSCSQKEIRRELQPFPKQYTFLLARDPLSHPLSWVVGETCQHWPHNDYGRDHDGNFYIGNLQLLCESWPQLGSRDSFYRMTWYLSFNTQWSVYYGNTNHYDKYTRHPANLSQKHS